MRFLNVVVVRCVDQSDREAIVTETYAEARVNDDGVMKIDDGVVTTIDDDHWKTIDDDQYHSRGVAPWLVVRVRH